MGQMADRAESLAMVLSRWIARERLRPGDVERASGVSRNHLWLIRQGKIARPTPETLHRLADALATDPATGDIDQPKRYTALHELAHAAAYPDLAADIPTDDLVRAMRARVSNLQVADFWVDMAITYPDISPTHQQFLRAFLEMYRRSDGGDIISMLFLLDRMYQRAPTELVQLLRLTKPDERP